MTGERAVIGRQAETATVLRLTSGVLVVTGEAGAGRTTLLDVAAEAAAAGGRVLRATGSRGESNLPFSGLHQLLRDVLGDVDRLPERQRSALSSAMGTETGVPEPMMVGLAALTLLSELSEGSPVLLVVDDIGLFDDCSRDVLAFVGRRIGGEPLAILVAARDEAQFPGFGSLALSPLEPLAAVELLDAQPSPPTGRLRAHVLAQAAGNPLALIELSRAGCDDDILPVPDRLARIYAADLDKLPSETRSALLLVAADTADLVAGMRPDALAPAEKAGLIRLAGGRVRFRHPLVRSAVYHSAPLAERLEAHRELAELLAGEPDRRAWHLAASTVGQDEGIAAALERTAARARARGGHAAAAAALERAAHLSPARASRARRLLAAAEAAAWSGQATWVEQLAGEARSLTDDPSLIATAALRVGHVLSLTPRHEASVGLLMRAAEDPALTGQALFSAAVSVFHSGDERDRATVRARARDDPFASALVDPFAARSRFAAHLPEMIERAGPDPAALTSTAVVAWVLGETALAVRTFDGARERRRAAGRAPTALDCSPAWAYWDHGQWAQARLAAAGARTSLADAGLPQLAAGHLVLEATAAAHSGRTVSARELVHRALATIDPQTGRALFVRAGWVLGTAAVADGDHVTAYHEFRRLFTADGEPVHYYFSSLAVAELVAAAVRTGQGAEAREVLARVEKELTGSSSARVHALLRRSHALLDGHDAEGHFREALGDPATEQWPFERAQVQLDYGEWLRRRRRVLEARATLAAAGQVFRRLGALPWLERAEAESRATGADAGPTAPHAFTSLTPQQQQIVRLAARGLTNREIGERLFLSPRTVSSHLYRSFPVLGVGSRAQLRDIVDRAPWPGSAAAD
ncbi:LuxR C-terminal-related transcriptional regulator [Streptomyces sp. NPDC020983]|uniref:helix-turn-helix transcriptional regulator n=1 Tax=Streptomyces sp. NPDC020983 TaxID=3365106 RepID=UPI0037AAEA59